MKYTIEEINDIYSKGKKIEDALIKRRIEINGDWIPNWSYINQPKYFVTIDDETCELSVGVHFEYNMKPIFGYFKSREKAKYFIKNTIF